MPTQGLEEDGMASECLEERWSGWTQINPAELLLELSAGDNEGDTPNLNQRSD